MPGGKFIDGERVELRTVEEEDIEFIQRGLSRPPVRKYAGPGPRNTDKVRQWYEQTVVESNSIVLLIVPKQGEHAGEPVGSINADSLAARRGVGNLGMWMIPEAQLQNYAEEAGLIFIDYLFGDHGLRRLCASTYETNRRVRGLLERFDFTEEGRRRESIRFDGEWIDMIEYGLLRSEYPGREEWRSRLSLPETE